MMPIAKGVAIQSDLRCESEAPTGDKADIAQLRQTSGLHYDPLAPAGARIDGFPPRAAWGAGRKSAIRILRAPSDRRVIEEDEGDAAATLRPPNFVLRAMSDFGECARPATL